MSAPTTRRHFLELAGVAAATAAFPRIAAAQPWPIGPIRAIVPFSEGSSVDILARIVLEPVAAQLGQSIVVENRGGAGGSVGAHHASRAEPDGYTILIHTSAHTLTPLIHANAPYDTEKDFVAVASLGSVPNVIMTSPGKGIKTIQDLAAAGKKGSLTFSSAGIGSTSHWAAERFCISAGFEAVHMPYDGGPEAIMEMVAGRVDFVAPGASVGLPFIRDGRALPLAVSTRERSSVLPDVPTTLEAGFGNSDYIFWSGMFVPVKTPLEIVNRLYAEVQKALALPEVKAKFDLHGIQAMSLSQTEFDALVREEIARNRVRRG